MQRHLRSCFLIFTIGLFSLGCNNDNGASTTAELASLRDEVRELKQLRHDVSSLEKDLADLRGMLSEPQRGSTAVTRATLTLDKSEADDPFLGPKDAPLLLMAFIDYQSLSSRQFGLTVLPKLKQEFADSGKLRILLRDFPLESHKQAIAAAVFAHCAGEQGQYFRAHDLLFSTPQSVDLGEFKTLIPQFDKIDRARLESCLQNTKYEKEIRADIAAGEQLGVGGVPSFFLCQTQPNATQKGLFIRGAQPYGLFEATIRKLLGPEPEAPKTPTTP